MTLSKQQFMARPKIKALPGAEKERRWKQHLTTGPSVRNTSQRVRGRGDYTFSSAKSWADQQLKKIPRGTFGKIGNAIAGAPGQAAGDLISHLTGRGDYNVNKNSLIHDGNVLRPNQMSFSPTGAASIRIRRREYIGDLAAPANPVAFNQTQFRLQPTDGKTFPWLASVANHFSEWELHGAILTFETTSSNFAQNMALGTVAFATQYNSNELPYSDMREILQAAYHSRGNPSECIMHGIECDPALQASEHLFTRRHGTYGPPNLYDHGVVTVATEGLPAATGTVLGRLFITYDVELNLPALPTGEEFAGSALTLWGTTYTTDEAPLGDPLTLSSVYYDDNKMLSYGTGVGNNIMALLPSNGPWARPNLPPESQSALVGWISDSSITPGTQHISFANPGTYIIELSLFGQTLPPGNMALATALTDDVTVVTWGSYLPPLPGVIPNSSYYRATCTCTASDQTIMLSRQNPTSTITFTTITVCV